MSNRLNPDGNGSGKPIDKMDPNSSSSSGNPIMNTANKMGNMKGTNYENPSMISSEGAVGSQFNPQGNIGQMGEKIGGPFSSQGMIGKQFDASQDGIAGHVERAVDGPRNPAGSGPTSKK